MKFLLMFLMGGILLSCEKDSDISDDTTLIQELLQTPEMVTLGEDTLSLETYIWRDFMPVAEENGSKMISVNTLKTLDNQAPADSIVMIKQYLVRDDTTVWIADYTEFPESADGQFKGVVREGPKWEIGILVNAICEFQYSGETYKIRASNQEIFATY